MINITRICSIDSSSKKTGWAIFDNAQFTDCGLIDMSKTKNSEIRIKEMCLEIIKQLQSCKPDIIVIEKLNVGRNMIATRALCKVIGAVYCYSILNDLFYYEISPSEWRSKLGMQKTGRKRDEYKRLSIQYVKDNLGLEVTDDVADSICAGIGYIKTFK